DARDWKFVAKGTCEKMGGKMTAMGEKMRPSKSY
ncbi:MAG: BufA1 family periplasmic bufferin-type metallophore, partial [Burkholderiaceae bacterium]